MAAHARELRIPALIRFAVAITVLNVLGHVALGFEQSLAAPLVGLAAAYGTEWLLETLEAWAHRRPRRFSWSLRSLVIFSLPAHITGLACAMLLYTNELLWPIAFAASAAIASKYLFRVRIGTHTRHFFNPSNFGITATLLAFPWIGIAMPYMFTEELVSWGNWVLPLVMITTGTLLNTLFTKRVVLAASWAGAFVLQAWLRSVFAGSEFLAAVMPMAGVAFILFTFYMVTDPSTTPANPSAQVAFGLSVAAVYGALMMAHVVFGMFFALSIVCLGRGLGAWAVARVRARETRPVALAGLVEVAESK